ncbi:glycosyltransferase [Jatrophihabitans sp. DSM 45814]
MRIVQLANFYTPSSGGLRVAVDRLGAGYREHGHETTLIVPGPASRERPGLIQIAAPKLPNGSGYRVILSRRAVLRALADAKPDLIEVHDKILQHWVSVWARTLRIPVIAVSHERLDITLRHFVSKPLAALVPTFARRLAIRALDECDRLVVCSEFAADEFRHLGADNGALRVVPLGVDLDQFRPMPVDRSATNCSVTKNHSATQNHCAAEDQSAAEAGGAQPIELITVSRLSAEKRPDLAISTLAELHRRGVPARLTLVGKGPQERRLRRQVAEIAKGANHSRGNDARCGRSIGPLDVRFAGYVRPATRVAELFSAADVALVPGPAETFGLAALEALACGTPTVAVRSAGAAEIANIDQRAGRAAAADPVSFADAVSALLATDAASRRRAAREVAEQFTWARTVTSMINIQAELVE